ncbi:MAG: hypothetical protein ACRCWQ_02805 [Bacilli bacterium]
MKKLKWYTLGMGLVFAAMSFKSNACDDTFDYEFEMQIAKDAYTTCLDYDDQQTCFDDFVTRINEIDREVTEIQLEDTRNAN